MRLYISGPMTGYPDNNYPAFHKAAALVREHGHIALNPAEAFGGRQDIPIAQCLEHDLYLVMAADGVVALTGWRESRGALLEVSVALALEKPVFGITPPPYMLLRNYLVELKHGRGFITPLKYSELHTLEVRA